MSRIAVLLTWLVFLLVVTRCAQVVPLSGGTRDTTPPKLQSAEPLNYSTNFTASRIVLQFDEFVQVRDLQNQLVVSPRLKTDPVVASDGKKIIIDLEPGQLAPNTTYRFAFGKAIADMHESNPAENFEFVFSTGAAIDSLKVSGTTTDALTRRPQRDVSVCLYKKPLSDSLPYKEMPDYIAKTDESGTFSFRNLPAASFQVIAFTDNNKNMLYDGETEKAAFLSQTLQLKKDTGVALNLFQENPSKTFIKKTVTPFYGLVQVLLNRKTKVNVRTLDLSNAKNVTETKREEVRDTVSIFYRTITDSLKLVVTAEGAAKADTLNVVLPRNNRNRRVMGAYQLNTPAGLLNFQTPLQLKFNVWMDTLRQMTPRAVLISVEDSITRKDTVKGKWRSINTFELINKLKPGLDYTLKSDTGVFFDVYGSTVDSARLSFKVQSKLELGKVTLKLSLLKKGDHLIQILNEQLQTVRQQTLAFSLSSSNSTSLEFDNMLPGTYQVRIVEDNNANGKWDTGNILKRIQPEPAEINPKLLKVIADWEIEEDIIQRLPEKEAKKSPEKKN